MKEAESYADLDALLRAHLDRKAEEIDPRPAYERIQASLHRTTAQRPQRGRSMLTRSRAACALLTAASVLLAFLFWQTPTPARAGAEALIREASKVHHLPLDRCYLVEWKKDSDLVEVNIPPPHLRSSRLWTRGDRFWIESVHPEQRWAWGRDDQGRVWMAFGPKIGVRIEREELSPWLHVYSEMLSMKPEKLLDDILRHFHLRREDDLDSTQVVVATPRLGRLHPTLRKVVLEIDRESKVIRRMTLHRLHWGRPLATVTYTLVDTQAKNPKLYDLEGHLSKPFNIYTRENRPERRQRLLQRWFGGKNALRPAAMKPLS